MKKNHPQALTPDSKREALSVSPKLKPMKVYLSGKIGNLPKEVYESHFLHAKRFVRNNLMPAFPGAENPQIIVNPCELDHKEGSTYKDYMMKDIDALFDCDAIFMLSNWKDSKGARIEHAIALELGLKVYYEENFK